MLQNMSTADKDYQYVLIVVKKVVMSITYVTSVKW